MGAIGGAASSFIAGVTGKAKPSYEGNFPTHSAYGGFNLARSKVYSAAGGMNLGRAISTEMQNKPAGSDLVIANSSETIIPASMTAATPVSAGGGDVNMGGITVNVHGVENPRDIANQVAEEIMYAMQRATYSEINIS